MSEDQDLRTFIREVLRRSERVSERHERANEAVVARLEQQRLAFVEMRLEIADSRKQIQANTQAVLSVLDRLD